MLLVGHVTSQQHASVSQRRIGSDDRARCHAEAEVADHTCYLTQSQYTDTGPTKPITPGAWQGSHRSNNFQATGTTRSGKSPTGTRWDQSQVRDRQTDRQTDRQAGRQADRKIGSCIYASVCSFTYLFYLFIHLIIHTHPSPHPSLRVNVPLQPAHAKYPMASKDGGHWQTGVGEANKQPKVDTTLP